ncbi:MAG: hypothetical protein RL095_3179 [Verrucomicrobiota bacterium]|jgi:hypothetical protein
MVISGKPGARFGANHLQQREVLMPRDLKYLEGRTICVVFCKLQNEDQYGRSQDEENARFDFKTLFGRASIVDPGYLEVIGEGMTFRVPPSAYKHIYPNDGTDIIGKAEYFVMIKVSGIAL